MLRREGIVLAVVWTLTCGISVVAQQPASTPQPSPEHKKLAAFVGIWKDEAELKPGPFGPGGKVHITETCEWFTGGFSLVCNSESTGLMGDGKALTVLNYDAEEKVYTYYELNSFGLTNSAKGTVDRGTWTFNGEMKMGGKLIKTRFTIKLPSEDSAFMNTEISADGGPWTLLMELKGGRVKQGHTDFNSCAPHGSEGWPFELFDCYRRLLSRPSSDSSSPVTREGQLSRPEWRNQLFFKRSDMIRSAPVRIFPIKSFPGVTVVGNRLFPSPSSARDQRKR